MNRIGGVVRGAVDDPQHPMTAGPSIVRWTDHALVKADLLGFARTDVEQAVLDSHSGRTRSAGAADWQIEQGRLVVAYNTPTTAT